MTAAEEDAAAAVEQEELRRVVRDVHFMVEIGVELRAQRAGRAERREGLRPVCKPLCHAVRALLVVREDAREHLSGRLPTRLVAHDDVVMPAEADEQRAEEGEEQHGDKRVFRERAPHLLLELVMQVIASFPWGITALGSAPPLLFLLL